MCDTRPVSDITVDGCRQDCRNSGSPLPAYSLWLQDSNKYPFEAHDYCCDQQQIGKTRALEPV